MRILLVEDKIDFAEIIEGALRNIPGCEVVWAQSRDSAQVAVDGNSFDLIILDRKLPSGDGVLDDHDNHGWAVFHFIRERQGGTPIWFLTGTVDADFAKDLNNDHGKSRDLHGRAPDEQMYQVFWKDGMDACIKKAKEFGVRRAELEAIALTMSDDTGRVELSSDEQRVIKLFVKRHHGVAADITSLNGGLSNSRVLKVIVKRNDGVPLMTVAAKVGTLSATTEELAKYNEDIIKLEPGGFPSVTEAIDAGCADVGGIFYGMVGGLSESLFGRIRAAHGGIAGIPPAIQMIEQRWYDAKNQRVVRIGQIRRALIGDVTLQKVRDRLQGIILTEIENKQITVSECCQHGDLHCANIVFDNAGRPMLIDFGDVGTAYSALDPVTMELSTVFHSQAATLPKGWPVADTLGKWFTLDDYVAGCPFGDFIRACRQWARDVAASEEEIIACAYAYGVRQLKYDDTNKDQARALISACIAALTR